MHAWKLKIWLIKHQIYYKERKFQLDKIKILSILLNRDKIAKPWKVMLVPNNLINMQQLFAHFSFNSITIILVKQLRNSLNLFMPETMPTDF